MNITEWRWFALVATLTIAFFVGSLYAFYRVITGATTVFNNWEEWDE